ncbi:MAG TPA: beta-galactosidase [Vicinamibacterales bacterium]|nr:beta-galactosidase [Vicinamibacterales bacterium]
MRRILPAGLLAALLGGGWLLAATPPFFPVAVWYGGGTARAPMLEPVGPESERAWRKDLAAMKALGFNTVRTWVEWSAAEPREGEYRFDQLDLVLKLAEDAGLRVIVQVYVDSAPEWVGARYPDGHFVSQGGTAIKPQAAPGFCFDHPGVRRAVVRFFEAIARRASASPALYAYDLWSEPAVMNWAQPAYVPNAQFCYCPHTVARFREWLKARHGTVERLNAAWYRTFTAWDQVEPPRFGTILTYADFMDWRVFIGDKIAADLRSRADAVRAVDASHPVTSHAPNPSPVFRTLADSMDASDDYLMKSSVDYFGTSFYPKLTSPDRDFPLERRALVFDMARAVTGGRGFYIGELQAGYGVHGIVTGSPITPRDLEIYAWSAVARGAKSISFYAYYPMSTGYEAGGYGLVNLDGSLTERSRRAGAAARAIAANADLILAASPVQPRVAVVFNPLVPLLGGEQAYGDRRSMHRAVAGYHRMFFERNIPVDFPSARELSPAGLASYALVIVPCPILMTAEMAGALEAYARNGGRLFIEARPGWQDERGRAAPVLPAFGWDRMLGVRESEVLPVKQVQVRWGSRAFPGTAVAERFAVQDASASAVAAFDDGAPAAFERAVGKGRAIVLGTFAGESNALDPVAMNPLGDILAEWAGLERPALEASSFVEIRRMAAPDGELVFLFNHGPQAARVALELPLARAAALVREITAGEPAPGRLAGPSDALRLKGEIPAQSARVYRVDYR